MVLGFALRYRSFLVFLVVSKKKLCLMALALITLIYPLWANEYHKVLILADDAYPPYSYSENEEAKGIYVDMVSAAAEKMLDQYMVEVLVVPWKRALHAIEQGQALAVLPPYIHYDKRPYIRPYSVPLYQEHVVAICHRGITEKHLNSAADDKTQGVINVGINSGYLILNRTMQKAVQMGSIKIWENRDTRSNLMKLLANKVHCYLNDRLSMQWELAQMHRLGLANPIDMSLVSEVSTIMSRTAHIGYTNNPHHGFKYKQDFIKRMDKALRELQLSGQADKIIQGYVETVNEEPEH